MMDLRKQEFFRFFILLAVLLLANGCATSDFSSKPGAQTEQWAGILAKRGQFNESASIYIQLAEKKIGQEHDRLTLLAIEQWLNAGDAHRARNTLRKISKPLSGELLWLWNADTAALALLDRQRLKFAGTDESSDAASFIPDAR